MDSVSVILPDQIFWACLDGLLMKGELPGTRGSPWEFFAIDAERPGLHSMVLQVLFWFSLSFPPVGSGCLPHALLPLWIENICCCGVQSSWGLLQGTLPVREVYFRGGKR